MKSYRILHKAVIVLFCLQLGACSWITEDSSTKTYNLLMTSKEAYYAATDAVVTLYNRQQITKEEMLKAKEVANAFYLSYKAAQAAYETATVTGSNYDKDVLIMKLQIMDRALLEMLNYIRPLQVRGGV